MKVLGKIWRWLEVLDTLTSLWSYKGALTIGLPMIAATLWAYLSKLSAPLVAVIGLGTCVGSLSLIVLLKSLLADNTRQTQNIYSKSFVNEKVILDGFIYHECNFTNVTFVWNGGAGGILHCTVSGHKRLETFHTTAVATIDILKGMGFLEKEFSDSWKHLPPMS